MNILLFLVPLSLVLLAAAVWAFMWAVRRGQFDDMDTPAIDILRDDPHERPRQLSPSAAVAGAATATGVEASTQQRSGAHAD